MKMRDEYRWSTLGFVCLLAVTLAGCSSDGDGPDCLEDSCSGHGVCDNSSGEIVCDCDEGYAGDVCGDCDEGYQDNDGDGSCAPDCDTAILDCGEHSACDDSGGAAVCVCAAGYQDNDGDGSCLPSCGDCGGNGSCDDSSGQVVCECDSGYQDNDGDGTCTADCDTAALDCGDHGACDDGAGTAACACDEGWGGDACERCADDWQDNDDDGVCEPGCGVAVIDCGDHGFCIDSSGQVECRCATGHAGETCDECAEGYQDNDEDGACQLGCDLFGGACGVHGHCDDSTGAAICVCDEGHTGDDCLTCADGYQDNDDDGACRPDCATAALDCGDHGACQDGTGLSVCACDDGYAGESCDVCAAGYQDNDDDGLCAPDCASAGLACGAHAHCEDDSGTAACICDAGYTGADCDQCAAGYQDGDDNGTCLPTCETLGWVCSGHGQCDHADGTAECVCDQGYAGDQCQGCDEDWQDNDDDGECQLACSSPEVYCALHSHCEDETGTAGCVCDTGYIGVDCDQCDTGYQDTDVDGSCLPTCETLGWTCSGHGTCVYVDGHAACICDAGYMDDGAGHCLVIGEGDDCNSPLLLDLSADSVQGNTVGSGADYSGDCGGGSAEEQVYVFTVAQQVHIVFETSGYDTILYLRSLCNNANSEIACNDDGGPGMGSRISVDLQPGTYYLFVDGYSTNAGSYTLTIEIDCPPGSIYYPATGECIDDPCVPNPCSDPNKHVCEPVLPDSFTCVCDPGYIVDPGDPDACIPDPNPYGEACADAMPLAVGDVVVTGTTSDAVDDGSGTCAGDGPDRVYGFVLDEAMRAEFLMTGYDTVLHIRTVCDDIDSEVACNDDGGGNYNAKIITFLEPGTYYVWADSCYSGGGDYDLIYSFRTDPCAGDPCPGTPECVSAPDWSGYDCVCPAGMLPFDGDCVDNPCDPNPCAQEHKTRCAPVLPVDHTCECNIGYIPDPIAPDTCIMDPDANEWAFIVFLNADNNLEDAGYTDVDEMGQAGSTPYVHIVALFDTYSGPADVIYVTQGGYDTVESWGEVDMSDWQVLRDFGIWAIENYPARHYAYMIWDHGGGWKAAPKNPITKGFSNDDHGSAYEISISNGDYAAAMQGIVDALGGKLDIVGFDACLMGMWEVADASAPFAHYLLASSETEPFDGWAYHGFMPGLIANWEMSALELATSIVDTYYNEDPDDSTLSVIDLDTMVVLDAAVTGFADALLLHPELYSQIEAVRSSTQSFYYWEFRDLQDFAERVSAMPGSPADLVTAADALVAQLQISIAYNMAQSDYPGANGLSIYFPDRGSSVDPAYSDVGAVWSQNSTWDEFLQDFCN